MKQIIIYSVLFICFLSCQTIKIDGTSLKTTNQAITIGSIGKDEGVLSLKKHYVFTALPKYDNPIKIEPSLLSFTKHTHKAFVKANYNQSKNINITYIDSLPKKPKYLKLELANRVAVISALNEDANNKVKTYLSETTNSKLISSIAIALQANTINTIMQAEEVFLEHTGIQSYAIKTYNNKKLESTVLLSSGVIFAYETVQCCWNSNKNKLNIVDFVKPNSSCPRESYKSLKKLNKKKRINVYKF